MVCPNCGAEYDDSLEKCPYCQAENEKAVKKRYEEALSGLKKREQNMGKVIPRQIKRIFRKRLVFLFLIVIAAAALWLAGTGYINRWMDEQRGKDELEMEAQGLAELEKLYQAGEYDKLWDCMEKYEKGEYYFYSFEKYSQVYFVNAYYEDVNRYEEGLDAGEGLYEGQLATALLSCSQVLARTEEQTKDSAVLGNEDVLTQFQENCLSFLERLNLTQEEKEEVLLFASEEDSYDKAKELSAVLEERNQIALEEWE